MEYYLLRLVDSLPDSRVQAFTVRFEVDKSDCMCAADLCSCYSDPVMASGQDPARLKKRSRNWAAVKELKLSYYIGETLLFTIYTHYGNLI